MLVTRLQGEESEISAGKIRVEFIKSYRDNPKVSAQYRCWRGDTRQCALHYCTAQMVSLCSPSPESGTDRSPKINAILLLRGKLADWAQLPPLPVEQEEDELSDELKVTADQLVR